MGNLVVNFINVVSKTKIARGVAEYAIDVLPKEADVLFGGLKRAGGDLVEVSHRVRNTGKSPYVIFDIQVKNTNGDMIDRKLASISDWKLDGTNYSVKWRQGKLTNSSTTKLADEQKVVKGTTDKVFTKDVGKNKKQLTNTVTTDTPEKPSGPIVEREPELPFDKNNKPITGKIVDKYSKKPIDNSKIVQQELPFDKPKPPVVPDKSIPGQKPIAGVLPPEPHVIEVKPAGIEPHPTQHIPNIRDYEMEALFSSDMEKRLKTIVQLSEDGRQALFDPETGKPNVFWTFNREEAVDYFLKLLGRK